MPATAKKLLRCRASASFTPTCDPPAEAGFSLIELLVVLAILGLLIGIVAPPNIYYFGRSKTDVAKMQINEPESALDLYRLDLGR